MLWSSISRVLLKTSRLKFVYNLYIFLPGVPLKFLDFIMVNMSQTSLWLMMIRKTNFKVVRQFEKTFLAC